MMKMRRAGSGSIPPARARPIMAAADAIRQLNGRKISQNAFKGFASDAL